MSFAQAEKRCAAYQENGYPAGRWRVPTEAEIWFMANRSNAGVFRRYSMEDIGLLVEDIMTHLLIVSEQEQLKELSVVSMMYGIGVMGKVILMEEEWIMVYL